MADNQFHHNIFSKDPLVYKNYVDKKVSILTEDGTLQTGIVYTVDPVSESVVLVNPEGSSFRLKIIMGHAIKKIELSSDPAAKIPELFVASVSKVSQETSMSDRKSAIKKLLLENRFPFTEENEIIQIENLLFINPPYNSEDIVCESNIILNRVRTILSPIFDPGF